MLERLAEYYENSGVPDKFTPDLDGLVALAAVAEKNACQKPFEDMPEWISESMNEELRAIADYRFAVAMHIDQGCDATCDACEKNFVQLFEHEMELEILEK